MPDFLRESSQFQDGEKVQVVMLMMSTRNRDTFMISKSCESVILLTTKAELSQHACLTNLDVVTIWITQENLLHDFCTISCRHRNVQLELNRRIHCVKAFDTLVNTLCLECDMRDNKILACRYPSLTLNKVKLNIT